MTKNGRWISKELKHLTEHMQMLKTDIVSGNTASAKTNWGMAMGIIKAMVDRDKKSIRSIEKIGKTISMLRKYLKPLLIEAGAMAIAAYKKEQKRNGRF